MGFEDQKQALQGLWGQSGREQLQWLVEDEVAIMVWKGSRRARSFKLTPGQTGELVWGSGKFVLDPSFAPGQKTAIWLSGEDNSVSFTWEFLSSEGPSKEGAPMPRVFRGRGLGKGEKGRGKGRGRSIAKGRGKSKDAGKGEPPGAFGGKKGSIKGQKGGKSQGFMRHIDRADGIPRTYEEMLLLYSAYWSRLDILAYFMECVEERGKGGKGGKDNWGKSGKAAPPSKGGKGKAGKAATGGKGPKGATLEPAKVNDSKRMDPADGRVYAWEELRAFYAPTYTKKQTEAYWERCTPIAGNSMKGKGKAVLARMAAQSKGKSYAKG